MAVDGRHSSGWQIKITQLHVQEKGWSKHLLNHDNKRTMLAASLLYTWPAVRGLNTRTNCKRVCETHFHMSTFHTWGHTQQPREPVGSVGIVMGHVAYTTRHSIAVGSQMRWNDKKFFASFDVKKPSVGSKLRPPPHACQGTRSGMGTVRDMETTWRACCWHACVCV